jgi:pimeloyl-ACP methyl ester carboxylesterase
MHQQVQFRNAIVHYSIQGQGDGVVFLHGYLESGTIWEPFVRCLTDQYTVICIDLPGHGQSGVLGKVHGMTLMADVVRHVLAVEGIQEKVTLVGHSMGGYVTMEYVKRYPETLKGYCLFHSTCFADSDEKRLNRDREISLVKCGKKNQIIRTNIPKGFSNAHLESMKDEIERCKSIALSAPDEGIIALLQGMKIRDDHSETLADTSMMPLIIWGKEDNYIGKEAFERMRSLAPHAALLVLDKSGHMGFLEEPESACNGLKAYLQEGHKKTAGK